MVPLTSQSLYRESQLAWLLNLLSQIKSVPARRRRKKKKRKRGVRAGGGCGEGMLEVPPASIYPKPNLTLSLRHMDTHARTHLAHTHHIIFFIKGHLMAAAYGGRPRPGPTNQTDRPAAA